jgi:hypothetical protein
MAHASTIVALVLTLACVLPAGAAGTVEVAYIEPEHFSDVGRSVIDRERTLKSMSDYLQSLGRQLPDGQTLKLDITDIDLAGEIEPLGWNELRVLRGRADWPHLKLRYTLAEGGRTLKAGDAQLADMSYLFELRGYQSAQGELGYEKRMVRKWFDQTFITP